MFPVWHRIHSAGRALLRPRIIRLLGVAVAVSTAVSCALLSEPARSLAQKETRQTENFENSEKAVRQSQTMAAARADVSSRLAQQSAASAAASAAAQAQQQATSRAAASAASRPSSAPSSTPRTVSQPAAAAGFQWPGSGSVPSPLSVPNLDGQNVTQNAYAAVDLSYTSYGFVKIHSKTASSSRLKVIVSLGGTQYTYDLRSDGGSESYPLQMGSGTYTFGVYQNISGDSYAQILSASAPVSLISSTVPFLVPNQMVNYTAGGRAASLARQLVSGKSNNYDRISSVLSYVAQHIHYDQGKAASVRSGYVPDVDAVLNSGSGICFDYASVSAAMLRSLGYPTKLITGYVDNGRTYHAWNEVYLPGQGWIKVMAVTLNLVDWSRVDVTFVSTATSPSDIAKYIGNGSNYVKQYTY